MNDNMFKLLKERPYVIPKALINNYIELGLTAEELIIIIVIMSYGDNATFDPECFARDINGDKHQVMRLINGLIDKNILSIVVEKNNRKTHEYISLDVLYTKLYNIIIGETDSVNIDNSIYSLFEGELGRMITPMEYAKINEWITDGNSTELITLALKEAVLKGVSNFNYIDSILSSWKKKGIKCKMDVEKEKESYHKNKGKVEVYDTDWLNGE